ncbi:IclR family transcriptional regulator [Brassicibacter mesophilus]|uniref:IclR family transcriptional regulator n=1 Tax=Brassicibacter mesophilus TaxID=745119 RepID=UPI003D22AA00
MQENNDSSSIIKSVQKSLKILHYILTSPQEVSIKELQQELGYNTSTVHHILKTMMYEGFVSQNTITKKYNLGSKVLNSLLEFDKIERYFFKASEDLEEIVEVVGETTSLFIKSKNQAICVIGKETSKTLRAFLQVGRNIPLHCTATGKAFLAYMSIDEIDKLYMETKLLSYCKNTITNKQELLKELKDIKEKGYSIEIEEYEEQINAVAVPIFNMEEKVIAVMVVTGPNTRLTDEKMKETANILKEKSKDISKKLTDFYY